MEITFDITHLLNDEYDYPFKETGIFECDFESYSFNLNESELILSFYIG